MPVSSTHADYNTFFPQWELVCDCVDGASAVKKKGEKYLPKPNAEDRTSENTERYKAYKERANFVSFTGFTLEGMLGMVFKKPVAVELDKPIEYLEANVNGGGLTIDQMSREIVSHILQKGRFGLLVDYPPAESGLSAAEVAERGLRANILPYKAENIKNWRTTIVGGVSVLSLVVLAEVHSEVSDDGFVAEDKTYHRVLRLQDGIYVQELYNDQDTLIEQLIPTKADGAYWKEIPFTFVGSKNNDPEVDKAPLYDIAEVNIAHYRNSADFEESSFMVGQPTPVLAGLNQTWVDKVLKGSVLLGSRTAILLPEGGSSDLLQANENQMPSKGMEAKEEQMKKIGARIIEDAGGNETAEAAKIRFGGQNSKLGAIVGNVESAFLQCFTWAGEFMSSAGESLIELNKLFYDKGADPQLIMARIQMYDRGIIGKSDFRTRLRAESEISDERTDEDIDSEAEDISGFA